MLWNIGAVIWIIWGTVMLGVSVLDFIEKRASIRLLAKSKASIDDSCDIQHNEPVKERSKNDQRNG